MSRYVEPTEQLVLEVLGRDIRRSVAFYRHFGLEVIEDSGDFVVLAWKGHRLFQDGDFTVVDPGGFGVWFATRRADGVKR